MRPTNSKPKTKLHSMLGLLGAATFGLALAACDSPQKDSKGQVQNESASAEVISLNDSSGNTRSRSANVRDDGTFSLDLEGFDTPYLLRAEWTQDGVVQRFYAVSEGRENIDVNALTDLAYRGRHDDGEDDDETDDDGDDDGDYDHSDREGKQHFAAEARRILAQLSVVLAPLFERYDITDPRTDRDAVRVLLRDVKIMKVGRNVTITNRATGGVIFVGRLSRLSEGVFTAANMPAGPGPLPATCEAFTYSAFGDCQPSNTQSRTVLTSSPTGCTGGAPVLTQACVYVPPTNTCTSFTYSAYGACQPSNTQSRTVLTSSPTGCTGGSPILTQACVYVPPIDGAALYTQYCAGCHANSKKGRPASATQAAIDADIGGMGTAALRALTPAQIAAIAAAP